MRCIYCDRQIEKLNLYSLFIEDDLLCNECRKKLIIKKKIIDVGEYKVETFYEYDEMFKSLLLQYKECYDEVLSKVFLYKLSDYINFKYHDYTIVFIPSSEEKLRLRGFNHLSLIFNDIKLNKNECLVMKKQLIQEGKNRSERISMIDNYHYTGNQLDKVLVVDDVITTGSSFLGAFKALNGHCRMMKGLSLARVEKSKKTLSF